MRSVLGGTCIVVLVLVAIAGFGYIIWFEAKYPCIAHHYERRWVDESIEFIKVGEIDVPIVHPGHYEDEFVCDKRKGWPPEPLKPESEEK